MGYVFLFCAFCFDFCVEEGYWRSRSQAYLNIYVAPGTANQISWPGTPIWTRPWCVVYHQIIFLNPLTYVEGVFDISSHNVIVLLFWSLKILFDVHVANQCSRESFHHPRGIPPPEFFHLFHPPFLAGGGLHDSWTDYNSVLLELRWSRCGCLNKDHKLLVLVLFWFLIIMISLIILCIGQLKLFFFSLWLLIVNAFVQKAKVSVWHCTPRKLRQASRAQRIDLLTALRPRKCGLREDGKL